jgi:cysteinyl-tRNA synthetase
LDDLAAIGVGPAAFRYYLMTAHYRSALDLSLEALRAADIGFERLSQFVARNVEAPASQSSPEGRTTWQAQFFDALYDDLDAPRAMAVLWCILADASLALGERARLIAELGSVLGLAWHATRAAQPGPDVLQLLAQRETARGARDFLQADALRAELSKRGFTIEDSPDGPQLHRAR